MKAGDTILRGRVVPGATTGELPDGVVALDGETIGEVRAATPDDDIPATADILLPGLVDVHCHGGGGAAFGADAEEVRSAARHHLGRGTTTLVGSVVTDRPDTMLATIDALARACDDGDLAAIHVEGPFLSSARCGAQDPTWLRHPDVDLARRLVEAGRGHVRMMTLAPELPGADEVAALLDERGVIAAVGHTEAAARRTEEFAAARRPGHVTHLFNGMPPLHHRDPGPAAGSLAAAARGDARVELIADGIHLADETVRIVLALLPPGSALLVSDAMAAAGMPDGEYRLGPQRVDVHEGVARLADGGSIAGGTTALVDQLGRLVRHGLPLTDVVPAASSVPADVLGLADEVGTLRTGMRADLVVTDQDLRVRRVMRAGSWVGPA